MKSPVFAVALAAFALTSSGAAAADLVPYGQPAPYGQPSRGYFWQGPYLGANIGYQWGSVSNAGNDPSSVMGGIQGGYNWQLGQFVFGAETDLQMSDADDRFARPLLDGLRAEDGLVVGDNEPYDGALSGDTVDRHGTVRGLANALIEIRQDLIATQTGAEEWAHRFARLLKPLAARPELRVPKHFPTRTRERLRRH